MKSTVYLVMTVTMNRRQIAVPVVRPIAIAVMEFDQGALGDSDTPQGTLSIIGENRFVTLLERTPHGMRC